MSMEMYVLSDSRVSSTASWQEAIDAEGFGLKLALVSLKALGGYLPARLGEQETGFECDHWDIRDLTEDAAVEFGHPWKHALAFRWGGNLVECLAAFMAATAYARITDGVVLDPQTDDILSPTEALAVVREIEGSLNGDERS